jgi:hypothetical protein
LRWDFRDLNKILAILEDSRLAEMSGRRAVRPYRFLRCVIRKKESRNLRLTSKLFPSHSVACQPLGMRIYNKIN